MALAENRNFKMPNKKFLLGAFFFFAIITGLSVTWMRLKDQQERDIAFAQGSLAQACVTGAASSNSFVDSSAKIIQAAKLLQSIPNFPGSAYQKAQGELNNFAPCINNVLANENFVTAKQLSTKALNVDEKVILPANEWAALRSDLEKAIGLLQVIPSEVSPNSNVYSQSQKQLKVYQNQLDFINQKIQSENTSINVFTQAEDLVKEANKINNNSPSTEVLTEVALKYQSAIDLLKSIPAGTTVSAQTQQNLVVYQEKFKELQNRLATKLLQPLFGDFVDFASSLNTNTEYIQYSQDLASLNSKYNNLLKEAPGIKNHPDAKVLAKVLNTYNDARYIWQYCDAGKCANSLSAGFVELPLVAWIPANFKLKGALITQKYKLKPVTNIFGQKYIKLNTVLSQIWNQAERDINVARDRS